MKIAELFAEIGFKIDQAGGAKVKDLLGILGEVNLASLLAVSGLGAAAQAIAELTQATAGYAMELSKFTMQTGLSTDYVQKWERAVERAGGTMEEARGGLQAIQKYMLGLKMGTEDANMALSVFGINVHDDVDTILQKMSRTLKNNVSPEMKTFITEQMGLGAAMQYVLQQSVDLNAELGKGSGMSAEDIKRMTEVYREMTTAFQELRVTGRQLAADFAPLVKVVIALADAVALLLRGVLYLQRIVFSDMGEGLSAIWKSTGAGKAAEFFLGKPAHANNSNTTNVEINVDGSGLSPLETANRIKEEFRKFLNDASYQQAPA